MGTGGIGSRAPRARTALAAATALLATVVAGGHPAAAQSSPPPIRYAEVTFPSTTIGSSTNVDYVVDDGYAGNWNLNEPFDWIDGAAVDDIRSNWGKPWRATSGGFTLEDDGSGTSERAVSDADGSRVMAPTGWNQLGHPHSIEAVDIDLSAVVRLAPPTGQDLADDHAGLYVAVDDVDNPTSWLYLNLAANTSGTITVSLVEQMDPQTVTPLGSTELTTASPGDALRIHLQGTPSYSVNTGFTIDPLRVSVEPAAGGTPLLTDWNLDGAVSQAPPAANTMIYQTGVGFGGSEGSWVDEVQLRDQLDAKILEPAGDTATDRAAVVVVHGGSFAVGSEEIMDDWLLAFAQRGYVAVSVDYRKLWQAGFDPRFAPNTHRIHRNGDQGGNDETLTFDLDRDPTTTADEIDVQIDPGDDTTTIEDDFNTALATAGSAVRVDAWGDASQGEDLFVTWLDGDRVDAPYPLAVNPVWDPQETPAPTTLRIEEFDYLAEQLDASPVCNGAGAYCGGLQRIDREACAVSPDAAPLTGYPNDSDTCDHGYQEWSRDTVRPPIDDVQAAVRWLKIHAGDYDIDPDKIVATGESAGSIITLGLANRPIDNTGDGEYGDETDESGAPNYQMGIDATIAAAAPFAAGWMMNGPATQDDYPVPPIAIVQHDWDTVEIEGPLQLFTRDLVTTGWDQGQGDPNRVEYHGWCGRGHGATPASAVPPDDFAMLVDDMARFFHSVLDPSSPYGTASGTGTRDGSLWLGSQAEGQFTRRPRQQPLGPAAGGDYTVLTGNFDGDGQSGDDLFFHDPTGDCESLWLGQGDGTFNPTPTMNPDEWFPWTSAAPVDYSPFRGAIVDDRDEALLVVGDAGSLTGGDSRLKSLLEARSRHATVVDDDAAEDTTPRDVIVIAPSAANIGSKYVTAEAPIVNFRADSWETFGLTDSTAPTGYNSTTAFVEDSTHPATGGHEGALSGPITLGWWTGAMETAPDAALGGDADQILARSSSATGDNLLFTYDAGDTLAGSAGTAPEVRVAFGLDDSGAQYLAYDGETLFHNLLSWADRGKANGLDDAIPSVGDFDGDGHDEIFWFRPGSTHHVIWDLARTQAPQGTLAEDGPAELWTETAVDLDHVYRAAVVGNFGDGDTGCTVCDDVYFLDTVDANTTDEVRYFHTDLSTSALVLSGNDDFDPGDDLQDPTDDVRPVVGNFDGIVNGQSYDDIAWFGPGWTKDARWYGSANTTMSAGDAFDRVAWNSVNSVKYAFAGNFGTGTSGCDECDDLYLFEVPGAGSFDTIQYGKKDRSMDTLLLWAYFVPTDDDHVFYTIGNFDGDEWDDVLFYGEETMAWDGSSWTFTTGNDEIQYGRANETKTISGAFNRTTITMDGNLRPIGGDYDGDGYGDVYWLDLGR